MLRNIWNNIVDFLAITAVIIFIVLIAGLIGIGVILFVLVAFLVLIAALPFIILWGIILLITNFFEWLLPDKYKY